MTQDLCGHSAFAVSSAQSARPAPATLSALSALSTLLAMPSQPSATALVASAMKYRQEHGAIVIVTSGIDDYSVPPPGFERVIDWSEARFSRARYDGNFHKCGWEARQCVNACGRFPSLVRRCERLDRSLAVACVALNRH